MPTKQAIEALSVSAEFHGPSMKMYRFVLGPGFSDRSGRYALYLNLPLSICSCLSEKPKYQPSNLPPDAWMVASKLVGLHANPKA